MIEVEHSEVADTKGALRHIDGRHLTGTRPLCGGTRFARELRDGLLVAIGYHWRQQPAFDGHGDTDVDEIVVDHLIAAKRGVEVREFPEGQRAGLHYERQWRHAQVFSFA